MPRSVSLDIPPSRSASAIESCRSPSAPYGMYTILTQQVDEELLAFFKEEMFTRVQKGEASILTSTLKDFP